MISPRVARNAVRGFWPGLGREKLGFYGHGRQPVRPLLITGRDPGSSEMRDSDSQQDLEPQ